MKHKISLLAFTVLLAANLYAQDIKFGIFADPQVSWFTSDTRQFSSDGVAFGFNAGFSFEKYFADRYAITTGASITNLGGNLKYNYGGYQIQTRDDDYPIDSLSTVRIRGQYISVPLGFKFKTNEIGYVTFYAQAGINSYIRLKGYVWEDTNNIEREVLDNDHLYFGFISYMFGGGIMYSLGGPSSIQLGIVYTNGLTPVFDAGYGRISIGNVALRLGVSF